MQRAASETLGPPKGNNPTEKLFWRLVIERVKNKLAAWKREFPTLDGKIIQITMGYPSHYYLSNFKIPKLHSTCEISHGLLFGLWGGKVIESSMSSTGK